MHVEVLHIRQCPSWVEAGTRLEDALESAGLPRTVEYRVIETPQDAAAVPFSGSPTILLDGVDAFPGADRTTDLACRVYRTESGLAGLPSTEQIAAAIAQRYGTDQRHQPDSRQPSGNNCT